MYFYELNFTADLVTSCILETKYVQIVNLLSLKKKICIPGECRIERSVALRWKKKNVVEAKKDLGIFPLGIYNKQLFMIRIK